MENQYRNNPTWSSIANYSTYILFLWPLFFASKQSFWIDEGMTLSFALVGDFSTFLNNLWATKASEAQMPGYLVYMRLWTMIFGDSELISRISNFPWIMLYAFSWQKLSLFFTSNRIAQNLFVICGALLPFCTYYAIELRPYCALLALGTSTLLGLISVRFGKGGQLLTVVSVLVASIIHMFGLFLILSAVFVEIITNGSDIKSLFRKWKKPVLITMPFLIIVFCYYISTVLRGSGGIKIAPSFLNFVEIFYEFIGLAGLGPDRQTLHLPGLIAAFFKSTLYLAPIVLACLMMTVSLCRGVASRRKLELTDGSRVYIYCLSISIFGVVSLFIASKIVGFQAVARHATLFFSSFAAPLVGYVCGGLETNWNDLKLKDRFICLIFLMSWTASSSRLFIVEKYFRDDYRGVISQIKTIGSEDLTVVMLGNSETYAYYFDSIFKDMLKPKVVLANYSTVNDFTVLMGSLKSKKTLLVLYKPNIYDPNGALSSWVNSNSRFSINSKFVNFELWQSSDR